MKPATIQMITLAMNADDSLTDADRQAILACCKQPFPPRAHTQTMAKPPERWLTPQETAEALSVNLRTIQRHIRDGSLPSALIGGSRRIPSGALERLVPHPWQPAGTAPFASRDPTVPGDCGHGNELRTAG